MTAHTPDALASAPELPTLDQIQRIARAIGGNEFHSWDDLPPEAQGRCVDSAVRVLAALTEAGYVLVHTAPDEATIERLARVVHDTDCQCGHRVHDRTGYAPHHRRIVEAVLAALAGTSAQARHTAADATGGGAS